MAKFSELVGTIPFGVDRNTAFTELLSAIQALGLQMCKADENKGQVVPRRLGQMYNLLFWCCWSD